MLKDTSRMALLPTNAVAPSREAVATAISILRQRFADRVQTGEAIRRQHSNTVTWHESQLPDAVVWPETTAEVAEIVAIASTHAIPIIAFGAGPSLEGQVNAPVGGFSLDFQRMNRILEVNEQDLDARVEAGVSRKQLNDHLRDLGLFFPVDPGAEDATIGGMSATRASGTTAVKYGTMRENVLSVTAVMADGKIVKTAQRARKSSAGYDLTRLLVGSEGTLGITTALTLRLFGIPETILAAICPFQTLEGACRAVTQAMQLALGLARIELLDAMQIRAVNSYSKLSLAEMPTLFLEFHGTRQATMEQIEMFKELAAAEGGGAFEWAERQEDRSRLWQARHDVYWANLALRPGKTGFATDVCVPLSRLADCVGETHADIEAAGLIAPIVGHVGDGNFHVMPLLDMADSGEIDRVEKFNERLVRRALAMGGTCTGEHGVGSGKMKFMELEHGPGIAVMAAIKKALDPDNILNPGKIIALP
jgi:D-lactate dehydrogenase (cytochrome)